MILGRGISRRHMVVGLGAGFSRARAEGFVSLMPRKAVREMSTVELTPLDSWRVEDGMIRCAGRPNVLLRSARVYRNFIFRAEWRFQREGWTGGPERWPNAGFFINAGPIVNGSPT